jgi:hypothetical protein
VVEAVETDIVASSDLAEKDSTIVVTYQLPSWAVSRLFRNVPILNSLEMSPFCVVVFSLECALKRSPVVRAKRKCVFQRAAL